MSALPTQITGLPVSFDAYIRNGWSLVAIPPNTKGPKTPGWNKQQNALRDSTMIPPGYGVGLCHAYSGTCAIDIDDWDATVALLAEHNIDLNALYQAADAVTVLSGRAGRGKLIYKMPFGLTLASKKIIGLSGQVAYELRCASANGLTVQDVLPPSTHPDTGMPYQWGGRGKWTDLPTLPIELLTLWQKLIDKDKERTISNGTIDASWDEIKSALYAVTPDCTRDEWVSIGMALHYAGTTTDQTTQALHLWDEWSSQSATKYKGQQDLANCWRSFHDHPDGVKLGTLFHIAAQYGWKRPTPDVSELFKKVEALEPKDIIDSLRFPAPDIDMSLFPPVLRQRAEEVALGIGCDPLVPLWAGMGAVCGAVDARIRLELMDEFKVPPVLWLMTIGDPAEKKTPGSTPMLTVLADIEKESIRDFKREHLQWEALDAAHTKARQSYLAAAQHPDFLLSGNDISTLPQVGDTPPAAPVQKRLIVNDVTSQKLVRLVAERPAGLLCHLDEMAGWVNKIIDARSVDDRSTWTIAYESKHHTVDRVGEQNSIYCDNYAVSIVGNIQPKVYRKAMNALGDDGLLQRFIPIPLRQKTRPLGQPIPAMLSNKAEWETLIRTIHNLPVQTYKLDSGAYTLYREFQAWYERNKQDERILQADSLYLTAYGKLEGLVGRLALVMHLLNDPTNPIVNYMTMDKAIALVRSYVIPAYRYSLSELSGSVEQSLDVWVLKHIIQISEDTQQITLSDLKRAARRQVEGMLPMQVNEALRYSMALLEQSGWVAIIEDTAKRATWAINPNIGKAHDGYRLEVIKAKQRQIDDAIEIARKAGADVKRYFARGYDPKTMDNT